MNTLSSLNTKISTKHVDDHSAKEHSYQDDRDSRHSDKHQYHFEFIDVARITFVGLAILGSWLGLWRNFAHFDVIGLIATLIGGYPIFRESFHNLISRRMTMELSMTIALTGALAIGEFFTALVIVFFVLVAEMLEGLTVSRGRNAIEDLLDLLPRYAFVRRDGKIQEVLATELQVGDIVIIKPGARIPVDGVVVRGNSFVDQAAITGESLPVEKVIGTQVYAGTINQSGALEFRVTAVGRNTTFGKIVEAVEQVEKSRAPIQKIADRLSGYLVYFALACAGLTFFITRDTRSTISVIIVAGACGIAAGTPLAILGAIGRAAKNGAFIKGGRYIEALGTVNTVILDKTGTLTLGTPQIVDINPCPGVSKQALVEAAAIAERPSEHPLGKAILEKANEMSLSIVEPQHFKYNPGRGISCSVDGEEIVVGNKTLFVERNIDISQLDRSSDETTEVFVARRGLFLGTIQIADVLRPEAAKAVMALRQMDIQSILLTGDSESIGNAVGKKLGVDEVYTELLPNQKLDWIKAFLKQGKKVAMVGDGINDAPALMQATVGVAMGSGTDVARESANVLLLGNDLLKFVETLKIARRCRRIIMTNFLGTLIVDGIGIGLAAFGLLNPLLAAFIHVSSELMFILNSARLLPASKASSLG
jgi:P-type Cu+ transporter